MKMINVQKNVYASVWYGVAMYVFGIGSGALAILVLDALRIIS